MYLCMKKNVQTRREFFKQAAKGTLPILGAIALSHFPIIASAKATTILGCQFGCRGGCRSSCNENCAKSCADDCNNTCKGSLTTYWK